MMMLREPIWTAVPLTPRQLNTLTPRPLDNGRTFYTFSFSPSLFPGCQIPYLGCPACPSEWAPSSSLASWSPAATQLVSTKGCRCLLTLTLHTQSIFLTLSSPNLSRPQHYVWVFELFTFHASWCDYCPLQQYVGRPAKSPVSQPPCPLLPLYALSLPLQTDESRPDRLVPDDSSPGNSFGHRPP